MATADEIRKRVQRADQDRMEARATAAAEVAGKREERTRLVEQLAQVDRELAQSVASAEQLMTRKELSDFVNVKRTEIDGWVAGGRTRSGRRRPSTSNGRSRSKAHASTSSHASEDTAGTGPDGVAPTGSEAEHASS